MIKLSPYSLHSSYTTVPGKGEGYQIRKNDLSLHFLNVPVPNKESINQWLLHAIHCFFFIIIFIINQLSRFVVWIGSNFIIPLVFTLLKAERTDFVPIGVPRCIRLIYTVCCLMFMKSSINAYLYILVRYKFLL